MEADSGPRRVLFLHDTAFKPGDVDLDTPGALAKVHRRVAVDESRNARIADDVATALTRGRNCLVLTRRVAHVEALTAMLAARGHQALVLQGAMSTTNRRAVVDRLDSAKAGDGLLVIGTTPFIGEGFDAPALDTLFLAGPISYDGLLIQCAARVIRAAPGRFDAPIVLGCSAADEHDRIVTWSTSIQRSAGSSSSRRWRHQHRQHHLAARCP